MNKWMKRAGYALGGLLALVLIAAIGLYAASEVRLRRTYHVPGQALALRSDAATLAHGRHLATAIGKCTDCHGSDLGGKVFIDDPALGTLNAPNLTPGGVTAGYTAADWERAIRHGVNPGGRALLGMPSAEFYHLSDDDAASIIAYMRSLPAVKRGFAAPHLRPVGRGLFATGMLPLLAAEDIPHTAPRPASPVPGVTREYGAYLSRVGGCNGCHREDLSGGPIPGVPPEWPPARNLTPVGIGSWTEADFIRTLRSGKRPDGTAVNPVMPWALAGQMSDDELKALWLYIRTVPPQPTGA
jgi:cytochrome c553